MELNRVMFGILIITLIAIISIALLLLTPKQSFQDIDPNSEWIDFNYVTRVSGIDKEKILDSIRESGNDLFSRADNLLIEGRLKEDESMICEAVDIYKQAVEETENFEERALLHETIASLECRENPGYHLHRASGYWKYIGNNFRAEVDFNLSSELPVSFNLNVNPVTPEFDVPESAESIVIGNSYFEFKEGDILLTQAERVSRDWLSGQVYNSPFSDNILTVFSERFTYPEDELRSDIGWHEGGMVKRIMENINLDHKIASGTLVARIEGNWYAPNEDGIFMFEVPEDKVFYPTTRFLTPELAVVIDTHGVNMLVEQALRNKADYVMGCCDLEGKVEAAKYLSEKGTKVICLTDRFVPDLLGHSVNVIGSAPLNGNVLGNQSIEIDLDEKVIIPSLKADQYAIQYYDTAERYFSNIPVEKVMVEIDDFNQADRLIEKAIEEDAHVIATRVFSKQEYEDLSEWLEEDKSNRAVLFHSVSYPYGYLLFVEFPEQTAFGDINLITY